MDFKRDLTVEDFVLCEIPEYKAQIDMGGFIAYVTHPYTKKQIKHIKKYFGWDVTNL